MKTRSLFTLVLVLVPTIICAQIPRNDIANPARYRMGDNVYSLARNAIVQGNFLDFQAGVGMYGATGLFAHSWNLETDLHQAFDLNFYWIPRDEFGFTPYNTNRNLYTNNALLIPMFWGIRKNILRETFDEEIIPYVEAGAGPLIGVRFPSTSLFWNSIQRATAAYSVGGYLGLGVNYAIGQKSAGNISLRYNILKFNQTVGRRSDYSGFSIMFGYTAALH